MALESQARLVHAAANAAEALSEPARATPEPGVDAPRERGHVARAELVGSELVRAFQLSQQTGEHGAPEGEALQHDG